MKDSSLKIENPAQVAVLIVDLQEEQGPSGMAVENFSTVLGNAARVIAAARAAGSPVIHARFVRDLSTVPLRPFEPVTADGSPTFSAAGTAGIEIRAEVAPADGELVLDKQALSCFSNPSLVPHLRSRGIESLIVCGVWTEACVGLSVRDAIGHGLRVLLVKDACGSGTEFMHRIAILNIANRLYGGSVISTEGARALLAGRSCTVRTLEWPVPFRFAAADVDRLYDGL
ncbi:MAG: isochorismatase family protein [Dongiaceae bacterium]